jgi:hypothetical protein
MEAAWNPAQVLADLRHACIILSERGLKLSAHWTAEQCVALEESRDDWINVNSTTTTAAGTASAAAAADDDNNNNNNNTSSNMNIPAVTTTTTTTTTTTIDDSLRLFPCNASLHHHHHQHLSVVYHAKTLLDLGEYAHAAFVLSRSRTGTHAHSLSSSHVSNPNAAWTIEEGMPPPLPGLAPAAFHLRAYALYMAGEKRKEEDLLEQERYVICGHNVNVSIDISSERCHCHFHCRILFMCMCISCMCMLYPFNRVLLTFIFVFILLYFSCDLTLLLSLYLVSFFFSSPSQSKSHSHSPFAITMQSSYLINTVTS